MLARIVLAMLIFLTSSAEAGEAVTLVIHTAADCPVCKTWRESPSGLPVALGLPRAWPNVQLVFIERDHLHGGESESLYPPELAALYQDRRDRYQLSPPVPLFEIVVEGRVVARQAGLAGWTDGILPGLDQLEARLASRPER